MLDLLAPYYSTTKIEPVHVDFESTEFQVALATADSWNRASRELTKNLDWSDAQLLANRYGQALGCLLKEDNGEAIGCITLEVPPGWPVRLSDLADLNLDLTKQAGLFSKMLLLRP